MLRKNDILTSFAKFLNDKYKEMGGELEVCLWDTVISGDRMGQQWIEGTSCIRVRDSLLLGEDIDTTATGKAQLYPMLVELFFKRKSVYEDERSDLDEILLNGVKFPVYDFKNNMEKIADVRVDAEDVDGANPILVTKDYQHYYWYVKVLMVYGG